MKPGRWTLGLLLLVASFVPAQPPSEDRPSEHRPLQPRSPAELARREARVLYGLGVLRQQNDRLLDAVKLFEQALALDPTSTAISRALIPLYAALSRPQDALAACKKVLEQAPADHETWFVYARQLKEQGQLAEARTALQRTLACPGLAEQVDLYLQAHSDLAGLHEDLREYEPAAAALQPVIHLLENSRKLRDLENPLEPEQIRELATNAHERLIRLWIQAGRHDKALAAFHQAVRQYPVLATRLNLQLARVLAAQEQFAEALARLDEYLRTQPVSTEGYELKVAVLEKLGRGAEVLAMLEAYTGRDPHNLALQLLLGQQYVRARRFDLAEPYFLELLSRQEGSPEVYRGLFALYRAQQKPEKAFHALNQALTRAAKQDLIPGDARAAARGRAMLTVLRDDAELATALLPAALEQLNLGRAVHHDTAFFLATLAARGKQLVAAERLYRHCLETNHDAQLEVAVLDGLLRVFWEERKYDGVIWLCERGLKQAAGANRLLFHVNLARALVLVGKPEAGLVEADKAVAVALDDDTRFVARLTRLRLLWHVDRHEAALAEGQALLRERLPPAQLRDVRHFLAGVYSTLKDYPKAEEQLQLVLKEDPNDATACNDLGYHWADQGKNLAEAERLIRKALDLDREQKKTASGEKEPDNAAFLDSLGWVLFRQGDAAAARVWLEKAATLSGGGEDPVVWDHLGDVYSQIGDAARAYAAWRKALDLYEKDRHRKADDRRSEITRKLQQAGRQP